MLHMCCKDDCVCSCTLVFYYLKPFLKLQRVSPNENVLGRDNIHILLSFMFQIILSSDSTIT